MILHAALTALKQIFSSQFRSLMWRCLGLTIVLLVLAKLGLTFLIDWWIQQLSVANEHSWLASALSLMASFGLLFFSFYLLPSISMLVSGLFVDEVAENIERMNYTEEPVGVPMSLGRSLKEGVRFGLLTLGVNLVALMLLLLPGINVLVFFFANALLLGREYFALAAGRFKDSLSVQSMRRDHSMTVNLCGLVLAGFVMIPLLNLFTPLFATAMMVHVHKALHHRDLRNTQA
jgi:CysZ protein